MHYKYCHLQDNVSNDFSDMREMFQILVSCLCDLYKMESDKYEEDFDALEAALRKNNNCGCEPYFGIFAHGMNGYDSLSIDFGCDYHNILYAEFYDGFSAPYRILTWPKQKVKELFELLKNTAPRLYEKVIKNAINED